MGGHGWGDVSENNLIEAVHLAVDEGVNFFDNADTYGLGKSEETLGKALKGKRDKVIIATKFGVRVEGGKTTYDNSPEWIEKALFASLTRLNTDYIDLYQVHYRDGITPITSVIEKLSVMKEKGYIRYFGLSNIHSDDIAELKEHIGSFVSFQDEYSLACRKNEEDMIRISEELKISPLTWGSLGQGILTGKYDINSTFAQDDRRSRDIYVNFHGEKLKKNLEIVDCMRKISAENGKSVSAIAIRFILEYITNSVVLVGIKNSQQLLSNIECMGWQLTESQLEQLLTVSKDG